MEMFKNEIHSLIVKLEGSHPVDGSTEAYTLEHLKRIVVIAEKTGNLGELAESVLVLKNFWLNSVKWCSQLSRDLEKLITIYEEKLAVE